MKLNTPQIRSIISDGKKYYSISDAFKEFLPNVEWDGLGAELYLESNAAREGYSQAKQILDLLEKKKPPEHGGFDKLLNAILKVPKS